MESKSLIPKNGISKDLAIATPILISSIGNICAFVKGNLLYSGFLARPGGCVSAGMLNVPTVVGLPYHVRMLTADRRMLNCCLL